MFDFVWFGASDAVVALANEIAARESKNKRAQLPAKIGDVPHERIEARAVDDAATVGDVRYEHVDTPKMRDWEFYDKHFFGTAPRSIKPILDEMDTKLGRYPPDPNL